MFERLVYVLTMIDDMPLKVRRSIWSRLAEDARFDSITRRRKY